MKSIKKFCAIVMGIVLICSAIVPVYAQTSTYAYLLEQGFSSTYLDALSDEMLLRIYHFVYGLDVYPVQTETIYLNENTNGTATRGFISENTLHLDITVAELCPKGTKDISRLLVGVAWDWSYNRPFVRKTDALAVSWDPNLFLCMEDGFYEQDTARNYSVSGCLPDWTVIRDYGRPTQAAQGGIGFCTKLSPFDDFAGGGAMILLEPKMPMRVTETNESGTETRFNLNYVHNRSVVGLSYSFPIDADGSVGIDPSGLLPFYDTATAALSLRYATT